MKTVPLFAASLLLAACASTPQSRIEKTPETFGQLPPDQQGLVKAGQVAIGFDQTATRLSLGDPDRVVEQETAEGKSLNWIYYESLASSAPGFCTVNHAGFYHRSAFTPTSLCFVPQPSLEERLRLVFKENRVVLIERSSP